MNPSIKAYKKPENVVTRLTHREIIFNYFYNGGTGTVREVSKAIGLPYNATCKRTSELKKSTRIMAIGEKKEMGNSNTVFALNPNPRLFGYEVLSKFQLLKQAIEKMTTADERAAIMEEFDRLKKIYG